jgi:hypothetical protein
MQNQANAQISPSMGGMSLEQTVVMMYVAALQNLQQTWMGGSGKIDTMAFGMQTEFLIYLIPDPHVQHDIRTEQARLTALYKKQGDMNAVARAGLYAAGQVIKFLIETFELQHLNVVGPASEQEYVHIPDETPIEEPDETTNASEATDGA